MATDKIPASKIMTMDEFNKSPLKNNMSYQDYLKQVLKTTSAFTYQSLVENPLNTSDKIKDSVKGWVLEKEAKKDEAEEKYYAALEQYNFMKSEQGKALTRLKYTTDVFGEGSSQYSNTLKKYNLSSKTLFGADINLSCARDQFNFANISAFRAYLTSQC